MSVSMRLSIAVVILACGTARADPVPELLGRHVSEAETLARDRNATLVVERVDSIERRGLVLLQIPEVGSEVGSGRQIYIRVSNGIPVPDVKGTTRAEAEATLDGIGIGHEVSERRHDGLVRGTVAAQTPAAGDRMDASTEVVFLDLVGGRYVPVPDVRGKPLAEAIQLLKSGDLLGVEDPRNDDLAQDSRSSSRSDCKGLHVTTATARDTDPPAGTEVYPDTKITLRYDTVVDFVAENTCEPPIPPRQRMCIDIPC